MFFQISILDNQQLHFLLLELEKRDSKVPPTLEQPFRPLSESNLKILDALRYRIRNRDQKGKNGEMEVRIVHFISKKETC